MENAVRTLLGTEMKEQVINSGSTLVARPDSGVPHVMVLKVVELLEETYGSTTNSKGFKVLKQSRVLQGDGLSTLADFEIILETLMENGYSVENVAFGMGGGLLQQVNRDTMKFALKACSAVVSGEQRDVFKDPITDSGKRSKKGNLELFLSEDGVYTTATSDRTDLGTPQLQTFFLNGMLTQETTFAEVRERARI